MNRLSQRGPSPAPRGDRNAATDWFEEAWAPIRDMLAGAMPSLTGKGVQALRTAALQLEVEMVVRLPDADERVRGRS